MESGYTFPLSQSGSKDFNKLIWTLQPEIQLVWDGVKADTTVDKIRERALNNSEPIMFLYVLVHGFMQITWIKVSDLSKAIGSTIPRGPDTDGNGL